MMTDNANRTFVRSSGSGILSLVRYLLSGLQGCRDTRRYAICLLATLILALPTAVTAQTIDQVKSSKDHLWGEGYGKTSKEADLQALNDLASRISVTVESSFVNLVEESGDSVKKFSQSAIRTYTQTSLRQAEPLYSKSGDLFYVFRYITRENLDRVFEDRKAKVLSYTRQAIRAEQEGRIGHAIQLYYDAYVLLLTHPDNASIGYFFDQGQPEVLLTVALPDAIRRILTGIRFDILEDKMNNLERSVTFNVHYNGRKVDALDYEYYDGNRYDKPSSVRNGITNVWFPLQHRDIANINIRVQYKRDRSEDKELENALNTIRVYHFKDASLVLPLPAQQEAPGMDDNQGGVKTVVLRPRSPYAIQQAGPDAVIPKAGNDPQGHPSTVSPGSVNITASLDTMQLIVQSIVEAIDQKNPEKVKKHFTEEGFSMFRQLIKDARITVLLKGINKPEIFQFRDQYEVRSIPVSLKYRTSLREFPERINFSFDSTGRTITGISFAISDRAIQDILEKGEGDRFGTFEEKFRLIHFMEDYQTAYALKRLDYIRSIFDEDAYILVGKVLKNAGPIGEEVYTGLSKDSKVAYIKRTKAEYLDQLEIVFRGNEYINLEFLETDFKKRNNEKIYGIQLEQFYYSTSYHDHGYLFLMLNMSDSLNPLIYVRTWQPEKDENGEIPSLANFRN
jgi:hypothetical protein